MKSDFSVFALFTAGLSCLSQVAAYTTPVGDPQGNPIFNPGLSDIVPAGQSYTITWDPTTEGTVTILLLRGPAENIKPLYAIAEEVENSGTYVWTPSTDLEADKKGYGIQLIVDATGQYQYSTQFGISNPDYKPSSSSSHIATVTSTLSHAPSSASKTADVHAGHVSSASANSTAYTTQVVTAYTTYCPEPTSVVMNNKTYTVTAPTTLTISDCPCTISVPVTSTPATISSAPTHAMSSGYPMGNSTVVMPTGGMTVPASLRTSTRGSPTASVSPVVSVPAEGAAGRMAVGLGAVAVAVLAAFAL